MKWKIVLDSSSDLQEGMECAPDTAVALVPLTIQVDGVSFVDTPGLDVKAMLEKMRASNGASSSACPSPDAWAREFEDAENVIAITISANLSGAYNSAMVARDIVLEQHPEKHIFVLDTRATSGNMILAAWKINEFIGEGKSFEEIVHEIEAYGRSLHIQYALSTFGNLVKAGRMPKLVGVIAQKLKMWLIGGATEEGKMKVLHKCRGEKNTLMTIVDDMQIDSPAIASGKVVITHCFNMKVALTLKKLIEAAAPGVQVTILPTHALTSFYAEESGIIISYE